VTSIKNGANVFMGQFSLAHGHAPLTLCAWCLAWWTTGPDGQRKERGAHSTLFARRFPPAAAVCSGQTRSRARSLPRQQL